MRSKVYSPGDRTRVRRAPFAIVICLLAGAMAARAQDHGSRQLIVPLSSGGFVAFKAETAAPETNGNPERNGTVGNYVSGSTSKATGLEQTRSVFDSRALIDEKQIIHRLLVDTEGRPVFGYDCKSFRIRSSSNSK